MIEINQEQGENDDSEWTNQDARPILTIPLVIFHLSLSLFNLIIFTCLIHCICLAVAHQENRMLIDSSLHNPWTEWTAALPITFLSLQSPSCSAPPRSTATGFLSSMNVFNTLGERRFSDVPGSLLLLFEWESLVEMWSVFTTLLFSSLVSEYGFLYRTRNYLICELHRCNCL